MKVPFKKSDNNSILIGSIAAVALLASGLAWLFLTDKGKAALTEWQQTAKGKVKDQLAKLVAERSGLPEILTKPATDLTID